LPSLPIEVDGRRFGLSRDIPAIGADTEQVFAELGMADAEFAALRTRGVVQ
jgi:crotonobetainyl-CoA:carnitine CoA-transferase CaiB-like acyl-CoA transferase